MERSIRARISAAVDVLREVEGEDLAIVSRTQAAAIVSMVDRSGVALKLQPETLAELQSIALQGRWTAADKSRIVVSLSPRAPARSVGGDERRAMQSWHPHLLSYFTDDDWGALLAAGSESAKVDVVFNRLMLLSARTLDEHSIKLIASLTFFCSKADAARAVTSEKSAWVKSVKAEFRKRRRLWQKVEFHVEKLPASPEEFRASWPALFHAAYSGGPPVPAKAPQKVKRCAQNVIE